MQEKVSEDRIFFIRIVLKNGMFYSFYRVFPDGDISTKVIVNTILRGTSEEWLIFKALTVDSKIARISVKKDMIISIEAEKRHRPSKDDDRYLNWGDERDWRIDPPPEKGME